MGKFRGNMGILPKRQILHFSEVSSTTCFLFSVNKLANLERKKNIFCQIQHSCRLWAVLEGLIFMFTFWKRVWFGFNVLFNNHSVISRQCLVVTVSSMLTFIVLLHCLIPPLSPPPKI